MINITGMFFGGLGFKSRLALMSLLAVVVMIAGNFMLAHQAMAGGPIMVIRSFVRGKDRVSGTTYGNPWDIITNNGSPRTIRVYPGDTVRFNFRVENWDPIPFIPGKVAKKFYSNDFMGNEQLLWSEPPVWYSTIIPLLPKMDWYGNTSTVPINGPGSTTPGNQFCEYGWTNPTVYDYLDPTLFRDGIVLGEHKFNSHNDYLPIPLPILAQLGFSIPFGNVMSCAEIAYVYNLTPTISIPNAGNVQSNGVAQLSPHVGQGTLPSDAPGATYTQNTQWQINKFVVLPTAGRDVRNASGGTDNQAPCDYYRATNARTAVSCTTVATSGPASDPKKTVFNIDPSIIKSGPSPYDITSDVVGSLPIGTKVCYSLSVDSYKPYASGATWRYSPLACTTISSDIKRPKVQVYGDDLRVTGKVQASRDPQFVGGTARLFGSWAQYGAYASGTVTDFATAAGLKGGSADTAQSAWSKLTFANAVTPYGNFATNVSSPGSTGVKDFFAALADSSTCTSTSPVDISGLADRKQPYCFANTTALHINSSAAIDHKSTIIYASGPVVIDSDIRYATNDLHSIAEIPQVVIIAPSISIAHTVSRVDAWLITYTKTGDATSGSLDTCSPRATPSPTPVPTLTTAICNVPLTVNGPVVVTRHLYLNRTADDVAANPNSEPAETFKNNGDSYLWAMNYLTGGTKKGYVTTNQIELPPRY